MTKQRALEILYRAVVMYEQSLESYHSEGEAHNMLLEDLEITEAEYRAIMEDDVVKKSFNLRSDAKKWIIDNQLGRRNLPTIDGIALRAERERILAEEARRRTGGRPLKADKNSCPVITEKEARQVKRENSTDYKVAKEIGISEDTYRKGKAIIEHGDKDVIDAVRVGDFSINKAYNVIHGYDKTPAQRQKEFMDSVQKEHEEFKEQKKEAGLVQ